MPKGFYNVPVPKNEPVLNYAPGSAERNILIATIKKMRSEVMDIPMYIGGKEVRTDKKVRMAPPHDHRHTLAIGFRSFLIGMVHGLAGTGALMILVVAAAPSFIAGSLYILIFGIGSIGGMLILSSVISIPFVLSARSFHVFNHGLQFVTALLSIALGLFWISPI